MNWNVAWAEDQIKNGGRFGPKRVMEQVYKHNDMKDKFTEAIRLMKLDLAYFEEKYQGKFLESCCSYCLPLRFVHEQQGND